MISSDFFVTAGDFDRIPVTSSDFQQEIWVESTKLKDNSNNFKWFQVNLDQKFK